MTDAVERAFADHVASRLLGQVLRYSDRVTMLKAADRLRIGRFRANLIIAMVQHAQRWQPAGAQAALPGEHRRQPRTFGTPLRLAAVVLMLEAIAGGSTWWWWWCAAGL